MRKHIMVGTIVMLVLALDTVAMAADPSVGTWKLNVDKSKGTGPGPKSGMVTITAQDNGIKSVSYGVNAEGKATHSEFAAKYDGKDYPVIGNSAIDTIALTKVDANTTTMVRKKGGKEIGRGRVVISRDGKTRTITGKGKDANGQDISFTAVYDKQ